MRSIFSGQLTFLSLMRFTLPSICMMTLLSLYTMVDGIFVANFVNTNALSAINLVLPGVSLIIGISMMLGFGGCAIVMKKIGEGKEQEGRENFSFILLAAGCLGLFLTVLGFIFIKPILLALGVTEVLFPYCYDYLFVLILFLMPTILKCVTEQFMIATGNGKLAFICTILGGLTNLILDYVFIVQWGMGIKGAAIATGLGYSFPAVIGFFYFLKKNKTLYFVPPVWDWKMLGSACLNGSAELMTAVSSGVITFCFNMIMLAYLGEDGVASITIVLYLHFLLSSVYLGYAMGVTPVISYYYGRCDQPVLQQLIRYSLLFVLVTSALNFSFIFIFAEALVGLFASRESTLFLTTVAGLRLFVWGFLFEGSNIFIAAMFTAFSNGKIAALLSLLRTLVFVLAGIVILPLFWKIKGIWLSVPFAETLAILLSFAFFYYLGHSYGYLKPKK